jgi:hypothetical protein
MTKNFGKTKITTISLILVLTFSATILVFPNVSAHDPGWEIPVYAYVAVTNNPIGVGQNLVIVFWPNAYPPTAVGAYGDRWTWNIEITKPSGGIDTLGPITSDPVGGGWTIYTPTEVGEYTIVAKRDEHLLTGLPEPPAGARGTEYIGDTFLASTSQPLTVTVQSDPIEAWSETPLTNDYWERPINSANREWYQLAGNWLGGSAQSCGPTDRFGFGQGPESAHVLWTKPYWSGGIMDERFGNIGYQTGHYEGLNFQPPIVLDGRIYYNVESLPREGWYCLDLYTGEELYFRNTTGPVTGVGGGFDYSGRIGEGRLSFGQIYNYESPNQHGGMPYLWSTYGPDSTWMMFDAFSGSYICSIANASSRGTSVYGKDGSILYYNIEDGHLTCWNTSRAIWYEDTWRSNEYWMWRPTLNMTFDGNNGFSLDVPVPDLPGGIYAVREGELIIGGTPGQNDDEAVIDGTLWALSLESGKEGTLLWQISFTPPKACLPLTMAPRQRTTITGPTVDPEDGVFLFSEDETTTWWGYDLETGQLLWKSEPEPAMNYYGMRGSIYQGKLFSTGYGGQLIAYNIRTGEVLWKYTAQQVGFESPYGNYPVGVVFIADGKIYLTSGEHSATQPLWRGPNLRCVDAETGEEVWKIMFWGAGMSSGSGAVIADGYIVGLNYYDNQIYCIGKGPSETTVTTEPAVIEKGSSIMIKGTVSDQSPGAKGSPAIADECQEDWMEYMYMQQPMPADAEGVNVKVYAIDPNGNYQDVGETTSDIWGNYGINWKPPVEGKYLLIAEFSGSASYGSSSASTYFTVDQAPTPATPIEPEVTESTEVPFITTELAIVAAVIVAVAVVAGFWIIRKRK